MCVPRHRLLNAFTWEMVRVCVSERSPPHLYVVFGWVAKPTRFVSTMRRPDETSRIARAAAVLIKYWLIICFYRISREIYQLNFLFLWRMISSKRRRISAKGESRWIYWWFYVFCGVVWQWAFMSNMAYSDTYMHVFFNCFFFKFPISVNSILS